MTWKRDVGQKLFRCCSCWQTRPCSERQEVKSATDLSVPIAAFNSIKGRLRQPRLFFLSEDQTPEFHSSGATPSPHSPISFSDFASIRLSAIISVLKLRRAASPSCHKATRIPLNNLYFSLLKWKFISKMWWRGAWPCEHHLSNPLFPLSHVSEFLPL